MNRLEVDSIQLSFGGRSILSNVFLTCETGKIIGILGRNGSGKSCLLKLIFGTLQAQNQSIRLNGSYVKKLYYHHGAVKFVPQDGLFMNYLTFDNLIKIFDLKSKLDDMLAIDELERNRSEKIGHLSSGVKKFIEILTILYSDSKFILLDEPFSFLSPVLVEKLIPHIESQSQNKGIILTDHLYDTVWKTSTDRYLLYSGNLKKIDAIDELELYGYIAKGKSTYHQP